MRIANLTILNKARKKNNQKANKKIMCYNNTCI